MDWFVSLWYNLKGSNSVVIKDQSCSCYRGHSCLFLLPVNCFQACGMRSVSGFILTKMTKYLCDVLFLSSKVSNYSQWCRNLTLHWSFGDWVVLHPFLCASKHYYLLKIVNKYHFFPAYFKSPHFVNWCLDVAEIVFKVEFWLRNIFVIKMVLGYHKTLQKQKSSTLWTVVYKTWCL